jgi:secondary thiamine-phosphate synthase enzyme
MIFKINLTTQGNTDIIDITEIVEEKVRKSGVEEGVVSIFIPGATGGLTTMEYEPGLIKDAKNMFEKIISTRENYQHDSSHPFGNAYSHLRATLLGPSLVVPIENNRLKLGRWQQIVFIDFDNRPRQREIILKIIKG